MRLSCAIIGLTCLIILNGQELVSNQDTPVQSRLTVRVEKDRLSATFQNQPLQLIAETISTESKLRIVLGEGLAEEYVSANITSKLIEDALRELFGGYDTFFFYSGSKDARSTVRAVWVYAKGSGIDLRPVPRSDWAGIQELEAALAETSPEVRETAYKALLERPDHRSRSLVLEAIKGVRERDPAVRERLLSMAISRDFPITSDVLADLARTDHSEHIRWMALDTLAYSGSPAAQDTANAAVTDASESIRSRAKEIIDQAGNRERGPRSEAAAEPAQEVRPTDPAKQ